ncbi:YtxH domain-containing protein [Flavobacterium terrigena]|uniref:YtxH-like protein n=1 Tax=Flavobacterium terrigena TaxID=402734 RepID=A0A1H6VA50_9FLAO|nr:YtxH domain-containing protein [Flavobacterium terrigena]SEJ01428.1 YtxH-like protein [Flavobacterium terrigena]
MKTNKVILGIISGMAIGAVLGVLFAPDKGTNTRKKIAKKGSNLEKGVKSQLDYLTNKISNKIKETKETIEGNQ